jgi:hypothetical protein
VRIILAFAMVLAAPAAPAQSCNRDCLRGVMTQYLDALVQHDPSGLPLAPNARFTEDGVEKKLGEGLWRTASGLGSYRQDFLDVRESTAAAFVIVEDQGSPAMVVVRLKAPGGRIAEIETQVTRNQAEGAIFAPAELKTASAAMAKVPEPAQRNTREDLIRLARLYPEGLRIGSFVKAETQFAPEAYRLENGRLMAGPGCTFMPGCDRIQEQRIPTLAGIRTRVAAVDEELGIVLLWMNFGPGSLRGPDPVLVVWEAFKIYGGQIHAVEAFMRSMPAGAGSGWD